MNYKYNGRVWVHVKEIMTEVEGFVIQGLLGDILDEIRLTNIYLSQVSDLYLTKGDNE